MRNGHCPKCGAGEVFRRDALLIPNVAHETYLCAACGYTELYCLTHPASPPDPAWRRCEATVGAAANECPRCGARLREGRLCACGAPLPAPRRVTAPDDDD
jgi:predicted nucleic-acid-binding Zn-ribbon protein